MATVDSGGSSTLHGPTAVASSSKQQAVNPCMDLVAVINRDVNLTQTNAAAGAAADPNAGLPPPPAGLSAARSAALMRMRMAARAKALAAAGIKPTEDAASQADAGAAAASSTPKLTRCVTLRLSLWRKASVAGEGSARVWDVTIGVPDRFEDASAGVIELEDQQVDCLTWSPDGLVIALILTVSRRINGGPAPFTSRVHRFACLYALHDGQQIRIIALPEQSDDVLHGMAWTDLKTTDRTASPDSAEHMLSILGSLPEIARARTDQESKARQRQRMFQAMRDPNRPKTNEDKKAIEVAATEPRSDLGKAFTDHPRALPASSTSVRAAAASEATGGRRTKASLLYAWGTSRVHLFLDGTIYLGSIGTNASAASSVARFDATTGQISVVAVQSGDEPPGYESRVPTYLAPNKTGFHCVIHLRTLATLSNELLTYSYDAVAAMRSSYRTMHADCVATWNRQARQTAKRYATHLPSEVLILLATGFANDTMMAVLLGNDALSENELGKMKVDMCTGLATLESAASRLFSALQRLILLYDETRGCTLWPERYGLFFGGGNGVDDDATQQFERLLEGLSVMARQTSRLVRTASQEHLAWTQFYRWWLFERARQEALRDSKSPADALAAAGGDVSYNVVMLTELVRRGFDNREMEAMLGITMDAKTRGEDVEDDDEEEDHDERREKGHKAEVTHDVQLDGVTSKAAPTPYLESSADKNGSETESFKAWYNDAELDARITRTINRLEEPPNADDLFIKVGRQPPTQEDIVRLAEEHILRVGPAHGLATRLACNQDSLGARSLKEMIVEIVTIAAPLFRRSFARWTEQRM